MNITAELLRQANGGILNPLQGPPCACCGSPSVLVDSMFIYNKMITDRKFWCCSNYPECDCYVGTHANGHWKDYPLGTLADAELRQIRKKAHTLFDNLWQVRNLARKDCYIWLQQIMDLDAPHGHIAELDLSQCSRLIVFLNNLYSTTEIILA